MCAPKVPGEQAEEDKAQAQAGTGNKGDARSCCVGAIASVMRAHETGADARAWAEHTETALKLMRLLADKKLVPMPQLAGLGVVGAAAGALAAASAGSGGGGGGEG